MNIQYRYIIVNGARHERQVWPPIRSWESWVREHFGPGRYVIQLEKQRPGEYCRPFIYYVNKNKVA